jgi:rhamnose utilization protein RhaD (predicted bifunctional aldolase and dehydrogenase)
MTDLGPLRALSARIGSDPLLVQAAGGNTSIKDGRTMWIKASGAWLRDALTKDIFVPLKQPELAAALALDDPRCESCMDFVDASLNSGGLCPSIETSVHGLMPQAVVVHVHCVSTIAWAIQRDAEALLRPVLDGFNWSYVPYARPGLELSRAIRKNLIPGSNVLVLGNHGLAVAAGTMAECERLLDAVTVALRLENRQQIGAVTITPDTPDYRLPSDPQCHAIAMSGAWCGPASHNVYYPDHVVFLGPQMLEALESRAPARVIPGKGVLVRKDAKPAVEPMLRCIGDVMARLPAHARLQPLDDAQIAALLNWDAEKYRQNIKA